MPESPPSTRDIALTAGQRTVVIPVPDEPDLYQWAILWVTACLNSTGPGTHVRLKWWQGPDTEALLWDYTLPGKMPHAQSHTGKPLYLLMRNGLEVEADVDCVLTVSGEAFLQPK